jgi:hypothetical protein
MNVCVKQQHQYVAAFPIALINRTLAYHVCRAVPGAPAGVPRRDRLLAASLERGSRASSLNPSYNLPPAFSIERRALSPSLLAPSTSSF